MALRKQVKLAWQGQEYKVFITMLVIERVDDECNILKLMGAFESGKIQLVKISKLLYILLDEAGAEITWEEVYLGLGDPEKIDQVTLFGLMGELMPMLIPSFNGPAKKKPSSTRKKKPVKKK